MHRMVSAFGLTQGARCDQLTRTAIKSSFARPVVWRGSAGQGGNPRQGHSALELLAEGPGGAAELRE
eukprot:scaffold520726_cov31-Prasinocladus_malaysianus.AAC.1